MSEIIARIERAHAEARSALSISVDLDSLKEARIAHLGDRSELSKISQAMGSIPQQERASIGKALAAARSDLELFLETRHGELTALRDSRVIEEERVDVTLAQSRFPRGGIHPLTLLDREIGEIFTRLGYRIIEGPELESAWLNFDALNIPADHPARTMQDTFFIEPLESNLVLRTHTSPTQIRTMLTEEPPIYMICPGRTFRSDELDATHTPVFSQVEGLVVDQGIAMSDLKGTLDYFAKSIFGEEVVTRLRPSFFPFTEPSAEVDVFFGDRWIEWGGCGMVNPKVLANCGIDTSRYSGFAFGMGLERTLMVRHQITDIRDIVEGDLRFTRRFGLGGR